MKSQRNRKRLHKPFHPLQQRKRMMIWMVSFWHPRKSKSRGMWRRVVMMQASLWCRRTVEVEVAVVPTPIITLIVILIIANTIITVLFVAANLFQQTPQLLLRSKCREELGAGFRNALLILNIENPIVEKEGPSVEVALVIVHFRLSVTPIRYYTR